MDRRTDREATADGGNERRTTETDTTIGQEQKARERSNRPLIHIIDLCVLSCYLGSQGVERGWLKKRRVDKIGGGPK